MRYVLFQILETASWLIAGQLLDFCYSGFLVPVLGSALFQVKCLCCLLLTPSFFPHRFAVASPSLNQIMCRNKAYL